MSSAAQPAPVPAIPALDGVAETALWTLWFRSLEAARPDRVLSDPMAVELVERLDYPFASRFGTSFPAQAQIQALRVRTFDAAVRRFLVDHPRASVVALGEGLETQFWRVDNGVLSWLTVDLPASVRLRRQVLPAGPRQRMHAGSALDEEWMALVPAGPVLITAQGLLMYLQPAEVRELIRRLARRFPGAVLVFDAIPPWLARTAGRRTPGGYRPPALPWTLRPAQLPRLAELDPAIIAVHDLAPPAGRGLLGRLLPRWGRIPLLSRGRPVVAMMRFAD
jgi:O-methyltransferase involved in polyketide biosynthesis